MMRGKITKRTNLPNGKYSGKWGGYIVTVEHDGLLHELKSKTGVRGFGIKVSVTVKDGVANFCK